MPTRPEKTALAFFASVILAGALVRLGAAIGRGERPSAAAASALSVQRRRADSLAQSPGESRAPRTRAPASGAPEPRTAVSEMDSILAAASSPSSPPRSRSPRRAPAQPTIVDMDRASASELEKLPRIGPSLARRIVADRDKRGPFGTLDALEKRVAGIGPSLAKTIEPLVTFSGR